MGMSPRAPPRRGPPGATLGKVQSLRHSPGCLPYVNRLSARFFGWCLFAWPGFLLFLWWDPIRHYLYQFQTLDRACDSHLHQVPPRLVAAQSLCLRSDPLSRQSFSLHWTGLTFPSSWAAGVFPDCSPAGTPSSAHPFPTLSSAWPSSGWELPVCPVLGVASWAGTTGPRDSGGRWRGGVPCLPALYTLYFLAAAEVPPSFPDTATMLVLKEILHERKKKKSNTIIVVFSVIDPQ